MQRILNKKLIMLLAALTCAAVTVGFIFQRYDSTRNIEFRTAGSKFQIIHNGRPEDFFIKGVNLGVGKPGSFPGEMQITKEEYMRWFKQIADMNANTVRVYTIHPPEFYEALFEYNLFTDKPLYIFHGVWLNEDALTEYYNAYVPEITGDFEKEIEKLIDVLHGNAVISPVAGHASGTYRWDVSPYVAGYILGIELDTAFVINTNEENAHITSFDGDYLYTRDASPHECWLAQMGDFTIGFEQKKYGVQKPISWVNWLTTDPLWHDNEPSKSNPDSMQEDAVSVDTEHILAKETFNAGLFAAYHIYPYYPEFMMFQPEYTNYIDDDGEPNPYKAYLLDLKRHHSVPVVVAEFGLPSSRGCTHENILTGYNQGALTEQQQGEYVADMFDDIVSANYAGGLVFTWQDEWFKRSWNTMDYDLPDRRPFWSNYQVSEQCFGLMAFEPGKNGSVSYADGDISEWTGQNPVAGDSGLRLYTMSDEKFIYLMIWDEGGDMEGKKYIIGVDSLAGQGNFDFGGMDVSFSRAANHAIVIDGKNNSSVLVDAYYDAYYRQYSLLGIIQRDERFEIKNSGIFNPMRLMLSAQLTLPLTGEIIGQRSYETGKLTHGNSNPDSKDYNSLSDFYINPEYRAIEMRIPWQLLNVADPSGKKIVGDLYDKDYFDINATDISSFNLEIISVKNGEVQLRGSGSYYWPPWETPDYHERLKESYYIVKESFSKFG